jgi:hypothetical protein
MTEWDLRHAPQVPHFLTRTSGIPPAELACSKTACSFGAN